MATQLQVRLLKQMELISEKEDELLVQSRTLAKHAAQKQVTLDKFAAAKQAKEKLEGLKEKASKDAEEVRNAFIAHSEEDERLRKELSDALGTEIQDINGRAQAVGGRRAELLEENARLKEQIKILQENLGSGDDKFGQLVEARAKETESIQTRLAEEIEKQTLLEDKIKEQEGALEPARAAHEEAKAKVDAFVAKFTAIQDQLKSANTLYQQSEESKKRYLKKLTVTENEVGDALKRAERAKKDYEIELGNHQKLEAQLKTLEAQTDKLAKLTDVLRGQLQPKHADPVAAA